MENSTSTWANMLISWAPLIVLIGFWIFFMKKMRGGTDQQAKYLERSMAFMDKQEQLLERIAAALERGSTNGPS